MKRYSHVWIGVVAAALLFGVGCSTMDGIGIKCRTIGYAAEDDIYISQISSATRKGTFHFLRAEAGVVHLVDMSPRGFTEKEFKDFLEKAQWVKNPRFQEKLQTGIKRDAPEDAGGQVCKRLWEPFWEYKSPNGEVYRLFANWDDFKAISSSRWVKQSGISSPGPKGDRSEAVMSEWEDFHVDIVMGFRPAVFLSWALGIQSF